MEPDTPFLESSPLSTSKYPTPELPLLTSRMPSIFEKTVKPALDQAVSGKNGVVIFGGARGSAIENHLFGSGNGGGMIYRAYQEMSNLMRVLKTNKKY